MAELFRDYTFNSLLINTFKPGSEENPKEKNKLKYHYTSPNALLSILKNQQIYFTDIRFLNDKSEDIYLVKLILDLLDENEKEYPNIIKRYNHYISDFGERKLVREYMLFRN